MESLSHGRCLVRRPEEGRMQPWALCACGWGRAHRPRIRVGAAVEAAQAEGVTASAKQVKGGSPLRASRPLRGDLPTSLTTCWKGQFFLFWFHLPKEEWFPCKRSGKMPF